MNHARQLRALSAAEQDLEHKLLLQEYRGLLVDDFDNEVENALRARLRHVSMERMKLSRRME